MKQSEILISNLKYAGVCALMFLVVLLMIVFSGCESPEQELSKMKSPVIVIGNFNYQISVKDSTGRIEVFSNSGLANSLVNRKVGDTIK